MLSDKGDRLNQVCGIHTKFKSPVVKGVCIACILFGILPLGGDFYLHLMKICYPTLGMLTKILTSWSNPPPYLHSPPPGGVYIDRCIDLYLNPWGKGEKA